MSARRLAAALVAVLVSAVLVAGPATAAGGDPVGRLGPTVPTAQPGRFAVLFSADQLPQGVSIDPRSVRMSVDGTPVEASVRKASEEAQRVQRSVVLAMDVSTSLTPTGLSNAQRAASTFIRSAPADVRIGLVPFATQVGPVVEPTTDHDAVRAAIGDLQLAGGTALYDGVARSIEVLGSGGARSILLLSDGGDRNSVLTEQGVKTRLEESDVTLDAVALGPRRDLRTLHLLTGPSSGSVVPVGNSRQLTRVFEQSANAITQEVVLSAAVPRGLGGRDANIAVTATAGAKTLTTNGLRGLPEAGPPPLTVIPASSPLVGRPLFAAGVLALFLGLGGLLAVGFAYAGSRSGAPASHRRRLSIYTLTGRGPVKAAETTSAFGGSGVARSALGIADRLVSQRDLETVLTRRLEAAGLPLRAAEWLLLHVATAIGAALLLLLVSGGSLLAMLLGLVLGALGPLAYLSTRRSRRQRAFLAQLPDTLQLMAGSLAAGYSLPQSLDSVVREGQEPIASEFGRALVEARLGVPAEDALEGVAQRSGSQDFAWVVMAITIQRQVGGNLAELLRTVAETLREREGLRRHVSALSAEGRLSAIILGSLPPVITLYLAVVRPDYLLPLFHSFLGLVMCGVALLLLLVGLFWMSRIVKVEV